MDMLIKSRLCLERENEYVLNQKFKYKNPSFSLFSKNSQKNQKKDKKPIKKLYDHESIIRCYITSLLKSVYKTDKSSINKEELFEKIREKTKKYFSLGNEEYEKSIKYLIDMEHIKYNEVENNYIYTP